MDNTPLLEATGLVRHYGRHPGVADIDLTVAPGDVVGLLGVNGAGKSTILQLLAGTLAPHAGRIPYRWSRSGARAKPRQASYRLSGRAPGALRRAHRG